MIPVRAITPIRLEEAKALSDELRIMILEMLMEKPMSVLEIVDAFKKRGIYKTPNAIRYHLSILKDAGLVTLVRVGSVLKYSARDIYYAYTAPPGESEDTMSAIEKIAHEITPMIDVVIAHLLDKYRGEIEKIARTLKPCEFCITKHFIEHVIFEIIRKASGISLSRISRERKTSHKSENPENTSTI